MIFSSDFIKCLVCAYVTENIVCERLTDLEPPGIELIWLELKVQLKKVIVGICYRAPRQNREEADHFLELLHTSITNVIARGAESIVLLGDFNDTCTTWDSNHVHSELRNGLFDMVNIFDMVQLVHEPTYILNQSANILDIVITDSPGYVKSIDVLPPLGSHHAALYVEFQITYPRDKNYSRHVWDYSKGNYDLLNLSINSYPWDDILNKDDLDGITQDLTSNFLNLCKVAIPNREIIVKPSDVPWMNHDIKVAIRDRNRRYKKLKRTLSPNDELIWKTKAKEVRVKINTARLIYKQKLMTTLNDPNLSPKKYWSLVKRIYGNKKGLGIPALEVGANNLTTSKAKATAFTNFFKEQQTLDVPPGHHLPDLVLLTDETLTDIVTCPNEVNRELCALETGKAHGADGVPNKLLKLTAASISSPLSSLYNKSFASGKVPSSWKESNVSPVHKKNSKALVSNYRPISLLSSLAKVQERIIYKRLYDYLARNDLLTSKNSGFKERDSAMCQLISIVDKIYKAIEQGQEICLVFLDISKAFDRVWHAGLVHKLRACGIGGSLLEWLTDYLLHRKIRVVIKGQEAPWAETNAGVPQGSILGPLLFLVFINDVVTGIDSDINLFADDTSIMKIIEQYAATYNTINNDLGKLSTWADQWLVTYNATKTVSMVISNKRNQLPKPVLELKGVPINEVTSHCHLGVDIENTFTWLTHILRISGKSAKCVGIMRKICREVPRSCLENLYITMVRPILEYGDYYLTEALPYTPSTLTKFNVKLHWCVRVPTSIQRTVCSWRN